MNELIDFLSANNLFTPLAHLGAALIALFAVIITQIFLAKRSKVEVDARFLMLEKELQYKKETENRKERLQKIEEVFTLIQESRELVNTTSSIYNKLVKEEVKKSQESLKELLNSHENLIQLICLKRLKVQLLISIYAPELRKFFDNWTQIEEQLRSCYFALSANMRISLSFEAINIDVLHHMYIDLLNYFDKSVNELSGYSNKT